MTCLCHVLIFFITQCLVTHQYIVIWFRIVIHKCVSESDYYSHILQEKCGLFVCVFLYTTLHQRLVVVIHTFCLGVGHYTRIRGTRNHANSHTSHKQPQINTLFLTRDHTCFDGMLPSIIVIASYICLRQILSNSVERYPAFNHNIRFSIS